MVNGKRQEWSGFFFLHNAVNDTQRKNQLLDIETFFSFSKRRNLTSVAPSLKKIRKTTLELYNASYCKKNLQFTVHRKPHWIWKVKWSGVVCLYIKMANLDQDVNIPYFNFLDDSVFWRDVKRQIYKCNLF